MKEQFDTSKFFAEHLQTFHAIASILLSDLPKEKIFRGKVQEEYPEYLKRTWQIRKNPLNHAPWARSCIVFVVPFSEIPDMKSSLPEAKDISRAGLVSAYAIKKSDYHNHLKKLIAIFAESLKSAIGKELRTEICVDTKPIAEKELASVSGIAKIGKNSCARAQGAGSSVFLGELLIDVEIPSTRTIRLARQKNWIDCDNCQACLRKCPTGAISGNPENFSYKKCICHLNMEKKGDLSENEKKMMGRWLFGCDECVSACPDSKIDPPFRLDIEWLIRAEKAEIKRAIKGIALEFAGPERLKRNANAIAELLSQKSCSYFKNNKP